MNGELGKIMECLAVRSCTLFLGMQPCKARSFSPKDVVWLRTAKHPKYFFVIGSYKEWALVYFLSAIEVERYFHIANV